MAAFADPAPVFPLYRKYAGGQSYFCVFSEDEFEEIKLLGSAYSIIRIKARILPERNYIRDLITLHEGHWVVSGAEEYAQVKKECEAERRLLP